MAIPLSEVLSLPSPSLFKLHLATRNDHGEEPLDIFVADRDKWRGWNEYRGDQNRWTRPCIFSLLQFYPVRNAWLFGGVWEVLGRRRGRRYELRSDPAFEPWIGRLVVDFRRRGRNQALYLEKCLPAMTVREVLPEPYNGEAFPGARRVCLNAGKLEAIFAAQRADWKAALTDITAIYVVTDGSNGKQYVGSAYGHGGLWTRWASYLKTGHGYNDELVTLLDREGPDYARRNFIFAILEELPKFTPRDEVIARETFYKQALLTVRPFGYNAN